MVASGPVVAGLSRMAALHEYEVNKGLNTLSLRPRHAERGCCPHNAREGIAEPSDP